MARKKKIVEPEVRVNKKREEFLAKIKESWPMIGSSAPEDFGWTSLTKTIERDLSSTTQERMQQIAFYLYDSNPIAHRILELTKDFVVGDGYRFKAEAEDVQKVLDDFWNDPDNDWSMKQDTKVLELGLWGEQCYPVQINKHTGHVKLGYLDPGLILKVKQARGNPEKLTDVIYRSGRYARKERGLSIIASDNDPKSKSFKRLMGDCFFFGINKVAWSTRGRSDLLSLSDWIDGYDQFLFARLERAFFLNTFIWDVLCKGMNENEITEFAKNQQPPKPGSARYHNENIEWNVVSPQLESSDASGEANLFKMQILGGAGFPNHWFGEGDKTTRATALEMGLPTLRKLKSRQNFFKNMINHIFNFVIDQAIIHGTLPENINRNFAVMPSPILTKNARDVALTLDKFTSGLQGAVANKWISRRSAGDSFRTFISQLGIEIQESQKERDEYENEEPEKKEPEKIDTEKTENKLEEKEE